MLRLIFTEMGCCISQLGLKRTFPSKCWIGFFGIHVSRCFVKHSLKIGKIFRFLCLRQSYVKATWKVEKRNISWCLSSLQLCSNSVPFNYSEENPLKHGIWTYSWVFLKVSCKSNIMLNTAWSWHRIFL